MINEDKLLAQLLKKLVRKMGQKNDRWGQEITEMVNKMLRPVDEIESRLRTYKNIKYLVGSDEEAKVKDVIQHLENVLIKGSF